MRRLRQQGDRVRNVAAHRLYDREATQNHQRQKQSALTRVLTVMMVSVRMSAAGMVMMAVSVPVVVRAVMLVSVLVGVRHTLSNYRRRRLFSHAVPSYA